MLSSALNAAASSGCIKSDGDIIAGCDVDFGEACLQSGLIAAGLGSAAGAQAQHHGQSQDKSDNFFHGQISFRVLLLRIYIT